MTFTVTEELEYYSPAINYPTTVYKHNGTELRVVLLNVPGPLCYLTIVVPTGNKSDSGLPHTLEHLIFCGSKEYPQRGYLDTLACRSLSSGTNAYTTEAYTAYTLDTAGVEGMRNVLPVYLQHVLSPTLRDDQFVTEVFHWDGQAKRQGVVYSEMADRENTSTDLMDRAMRQQLYSDNSTYYYECGGLTQDIMRLNNEQIKEYHQRYYQPGQLTLILAGANLDSSILTEIDIILDTINQGTKKAINQPPVFCAEYQTLTKDITSQAVKFASVEEDVGDIAYGWHGPSLSDAKTCMALQILFRYLEDIAAAPLRQRFTEQERPWASFIWSHLYCYARPYFVIGFSGIPYELEIGEETNSDSNDEKDYTPPPKLLEHGVFYEAFKQVLCQVAKEGFTGQQKISDTIERHRKKLCEEMEYSPHEVLMEWTIQDVVAQTFLNHENIIDIPKIGSQANVFNIIDELTNEDEIYWKTLLKRWLIDAPMVEVIMIPDAKLAETLEKTSLQQEQEKRNQLGDEGLAQLAATVERATKANQVNVPSELIAKMPPPPLVAHVPQLESTAQISQMSATSRPFASMQLVSTSTLFIHLSIGFPVAVLPQHLRPWLVLFQSLLFESSVKIHDVMSGIDVSVDDSKLVDYREVATGMARDLVSHDASVGYGNQLIGTTWLSDYLVVTGSCAPQNYNKMLGWLLGALAGVVFDAERIGAIARNLLSDISELQREGSNMMQAIMARTTMTKVFNSATSAAPGNQYGEKSITTNQNDICISLFRQRAFLKGVLGRLKTPEGIDEIVTALDSIRLYLLTTHYSDSLKDSRSELGGFLQIATPSETSHDELYQKFFTSWDKIAPSSEQATNVSFSDNQGPFPMPRSPYQVDTDVQLAIPGGLLIVSLPALSASYLSCILPCDVLAPVNDLQDARHVDYFAINVFCELLSRADGPIYEAVRGKGYAYGADVSLHPWHGQLVYSVFRAQDPAQALNAFWQLLEKLDTHWDSVCDIHALEAARSTVAYAWFSKRSTCGGVINAALNNAFRGFTSPQEQEQYFVNRLALVKMDDLKHVYNKYFKGFISNEKVVKLLLTPPVPSDTVIKPIVQDHRLGPINEVQLIDFFIIDTAVDGQVDIIFDSDEEEDGSDE
ncbi:hypothetical protein BDF19DRAFT_440953 [Syncephalis fuscata]|nr:hypothetical protein BDF19DRAFT_440953 [Syncephalis fuscata]